MVFKFEIDTSKLNDSNPESIEQTIKDFQMIIQVLCNANPDYYIIGGMLKEQMDKQVKQIDAYVSPYTYAVSTMPDELSKESDWLTPATKVGAAKIKFLEVIKNDYKLNLVKIAAFELGFTIRDVVSGPNQAWFKWIDDVVKYYRQCNKEQED